MGNENSALHVAAQDGQEKIVRLLLDRGARVDALGFRDSTALMQAANKGHTASLAAILEAKPSLHLRSQAAEGAKQGDSAILFAAGAEEGDALGCVEKLITAGANPNDSGGVKGWSVLMKAAFKANLKLVQVRRPPRD